MKRSNILASSSIYALVFLVSRCLSDFSVLNIPPELGTSMANSSLTPSNTLNPPQCVNVSNNPGWLSLTGPIEPQICTKALVNIVNAVKGHENQNFIFYSKQAFPNGPPGNGTPWLLPVGSETSFAEGNCVAVVRMRRDLTQGVLPYETGRFAAQGGQPLQVSTWAAIIREFQDLIVTCVGGSSPRKSAWGAVGQDIIVALWPRGAPVDNLFGFYSGGALSRNNTNVTIPVPAVVNGVSTVITRTTLAPVEQNSLTFASVAGAPSATQAFSYGTGSGEDVGGGVNGGITKRGDHEDEGEGEGELVEEEEEGSVPPPEPKPVDEGVKGIPWDGLLGDDEAVIELKEKRAAMEEERMNNRALSKRMRRFKARERSAYVAARA